MKRQRPKLKITVKHAEETPESERLLIEALKVTRRIGQEVLKEERANGRKSTGSSADRLKDHATES